MKNKKNSGSDVQNKKSSQSDVKNVQTSNKKSCDTKNCG